MRWWSGALGVAIVLISADAAASTQCYRRRYSEDHLASQPRHVVELIELAWAAAPDIGPDATRAVMRVRFRDYYDPFATFLARATCRPAPLEAGLPPGAIACEGESGGGLRAWFEDTDRIMIRTESFDVLGGEGDGGGPEMRPVADTGTTGTRFRLYAADPATCAHP